MNYFDIFRIAYDDIKIIADHPESIITRVIKIDSGYIGEIVLLGVHPERSSNILFFHEDSFNSETKVFDDLKQIIDTITKASLSTKNSELLRKNNLQE